MVASVPFGLSGSMKDQLAPLDLHRVERERESNVRLRGSSSSAVGSSLGSVLGILQLNPPASSGSSSVPAPLHSEFSDLSDQRLSAYINTHFLRFCARLSRIDFQHMLILIQPVLWTPPLQVPGLVLFTFLSDDLV